MIEKTSEFYNSKQTELQSSQYFFPYHYIPEAYGKLYLSKHWRFAPSYVAAIHLVEKHIKKINPNINSNFVHLDIGCGDGALLYYLTKNFGLNESNVEGVDYDKRAINLASHINPDITFYSDPVDKLDKKYDSASLIEVIEHIHPKELNSFIENVASRLKENAKLLVTVPSIEKQISNKHYQHFTFESIKEILSNHFCINEIYGFERQSKFVNLLHKIRKNRWFALDAPAINAQLVKQYKKLYVEQNKCGRILVICTVKNNHE